MHIKDMGEGTWTQRLASHAMLPAGELCGSVVYADGPYGRLSPSLRNAGNTVVLLAGGMGITPMIHALQQLVQDHSRPGNIRRVLLVWSVRHREQLAPFAAILQDIQQVMMLRAPQDAGTAGDSQANEIRIFVTTAGRTKEDPPSHVSGESEDHPLGDQRTVDAAQRERAINGNEGSEMEPLLPGTSSGSVIGAGSIRPDFSCSGGDLEQGQQIARTIATEAGRPPLDSILAVVARQSACAATVYVCGPPRLVMDAEHLCTRSGLTCHAETFLF